MIEVMEVCVSSGPFPALSVVNDVLRARANPAHASQVDVEQAMREIKGGLAIVEPDLTFWTKVLLREIDEHASKHFVRCKDSLGIPSDDYNNSMIKYVRAVLDSMKTIQQGHPLLDRAMSRFKWLMSDKTQDIYPLPILTDFVFKGLVESLTSTTQGFNAVSVCNLLQGAHRIDDRRYSALTL